MVQMRERGLFAIHRYAGRSMTKQMRHLVIAYVHGVLDGSTIAGLACAYNARSNPSAQEQLAFLLTHDR
jgi:hypothetical protein